MKRLLALALMAAVVYAAYLLVPYTRSEPRVDPTRHLATYVTAEVVSVIPLRLDGSSVQPTLDRLATVRHGDGNQGDVLLVTDEAIGPGDLVNLYVLQVADPVTGKGTTVTLATKHGR